MAGLVPKNNLRIAKFVCLDRVIQLWITTITQAQELSALSRPKKTTMTVLLNVLFSTTVLSFKRELKTFDRWKIINQQYIYQIRKFAKSVLPRYVTNKQKDNISRRGNFFRLPECEWFGVAGGKIHKNNFL